MTSRATVSVRLVQIGFIAAFLLAWYEAGRRGLVNPLLLPRIDGVYRDFVSLAGTGQMLGNLRTTMYELAAAYAIAAVAGTGVGLNLLGQSLSGDFAFERTVDAGGQPIVRVQAGNVTVGLGGNGTPVLNAKHLIGDEPFAVLWGDDVFTGTPPHLAQLMRVYERYTDPVLTAFPVDDEGTTRYGMIEGKAVGRGVYEVSAVREKPGPKTKSRLAALGGYILTPDIFPFLEKTKPGKGGELWLVDAILALAQRRPVYACVVKGEYYDVGSKLGWLKANVDFALQRKELQQPFRAWLHQRLKSQRT